MTTRGSVLPSERSTQYNLVMRSRCWIVINVLLPGTGLVVVRREWLGLSIAMLFTVLVQIVLIGAMITPALVPRWAILGAGFGAVVVWATAQWRFRLGLREVTDPATKLEIQSLRRRARQAIEADDLESALQLLTVATELDDEDPDILAARADVLNRLDR